MKTDICFAICWDRKFDVPAVALMNTIRKFYSPRDATILAFTEEREYRAPLIIEALRYSPELRQLNGVSMLKAKAYVTHYALAEIGSELVIHIDCDAFLCSKIPLLAFLDAPDRMVGFKDGPDRMALAEYRTIIGKDFPPSARVSDYNLNGGVVMYRNGDHVRALARDFVDACRNEYIWACARHDQNILQALVAQHAIGCGLQFKLHDDPRFDPYGNWVDYLTQSGEVWLNKNGDQQFIWHGIGGRWGDNVPAGVKEAWAWAQK